MTTAPPDPQPTLAALDDDLGSGELTPLRRVADQVLRIGRMLGEDRSCEDVLIQFAAVQGALRAVGQQVLACHLADALGAVSAGKLPAVAAAEEAAFLAGLLAGVSSPHSGALPAGGRPSRHGNRRTSTAQPDQLRSVRQAIR